MAGKNWTVKSYTNDTWTDLATEPAELGAILIVNTTAGALTAQISLTDDGNTERSRILPAASIAANTSEKLDMTGFAIGRADKIRVKGSAAGLHFIASGKQEE